MAFLLSLILLARVTAYAPLDNISGICADSNPSITATGTSPQRGTIAADPSKLPYGTRLYIPGYGTGTVEDTGGALKQDGLRIDVYMDTYEEAIAWGVRYIEVELLDSSIQIR